MNFLKIYNNNPKEKSEEKGVILILLVILMPAIVVMLGLAVDIGFFFLNRSSMQQSVDAASLGAVQTFQGYRTSSLDTHTPDIMSFRDVKVLILAMFLAQVTPETHTDPDNNTFVSKGLRGINDEAIQALQNRTVMFNHLPLGGAQGFEQNCALGDYNLNHPFHQSNCAKFGNVTMLATRGVRCYGGFTRYFCSLENLTGLNPDAWQYANSAQIDMRIDGVNSFFARAFLGVQSSDIVVKSGSYLRFQSQVCGLPSCIDILGVDPTMIPTACQAILGFQ